MVNSGMIKWAIKTKIFKRIYIILLSISFNLVLFDPIILFTNPQTLVDPGYTKPSKTLLVLTFIFSIFKSGLDLITNSISFILKFVNLKYVSSHLIIIPFRNNKKLN